MLKGSLYYICTTNYNPKGFDLKTPKTILQPSSSYIRRQIEYLHLQFISLLTSNMNKQLKQRPNLDIKTNLSGLEKTLDMMCELGDKSPTVILNAFQPLRIEDRARKMIEGIVDEHKPEHFCIGMLVTGLNPICLMIDPSKVIEIKPQGKSFFPHFISKIST